MTQTVFLFLEETKLKTKYKFEFLAILSILIYAISFG